MAAVRAVARYVSRILDEALTGPADQTHYDQLRK